MQVRNCEKNGCCKIIEITRPGKLAGSTFLFAGKLDFKTCQSVKRFNKLSVMADIGISFWHNITIYRSFWRFICQFARPSAGTLVLHNSVQCSLWPCTIKQRSQFLVRNFFGFRNNDDLIENHYGPTKKNGQFLFLMLLSCLIDIST